MAGKKQEWRAVPAEGEYFDFGKLDFDGASEEIAKGKIAPAKIEVEGKLPKGVSAFPLSEISPSVISLIESHGMPKISHDKVTLWAEANQNSGMVLHAKDASEGEISFLVKAESSSSTKFVILAGKGAKISVVLKFISEVDAKHSKNSAPIRVDAIEAYLSEDSELNLATIQDYSQSGAAFTQVRSSLGRFARLSHLAGNFGAGESRLRVENHMAGGHSRANSLQAFFCTGKQFADVRASTYHHVPETTGEMLARGALSGSAKCAYKGYIKIDEGARNTITHQGGTALLLSTHAAANVMPALDVENNEVEAGHGAAVGELSEEEMFYLRSRGIGEEEARALIVSGYFKALLSTYPHAAGREAVSSILDGRIAGIKSAAQK